MSNIHKKLAEMLKSCKSIQANRIRMMCPMVRPGAQVIRAAEILEERIDMVISPPGRVPVKYRALKILQDYPK